METEDRRSAALQKIEAAHAEVLITSYETCRRDSPGLRQRLPR